MALANFRDPQPLGADKFTLTTPVAIEPSTVDKAVHWVHYTDRDLVLTRAIFGFIITASTDDSDLVVTLAYKTVALDTAIASPNGAGSYTDLAAATLGDDFGATDGILHSVLDSSNDPVRVPAGSLIVLKVVVDGVLPLELAVGAMLQLNGYYPK